MTWLLDGSVLVALAIDSHEAHRPATRWFANSVDRFATCAITQGTLLRLHLQLAVDASVAAAWETLRCFASHPRHEYWDDGFSYLEVPLDGLQGHRQVTDAWLAELARRRGGRVATLDAAFATLYPDRVKLVPLVQAAGSS